jgi:hypothetical protein
VPEAPQVHVVDDAADATPPAEGSEPEYIEPGATTHGEVRPEPAEQSNGVHIAEPAPELFGPEPVVMQPARPQSGRTELPIEEVLRHLQATPLPPTPQETDDDGSYRPDDRPEVEQASEPLTAEPKQPGIEKPIEASAEEATPEMISAAGPVAAQEPVAEPPEGEPREEEVAAPDQAAILPEASPPVEAATSPEVPEPAEEPAIAAESDSIAGTVVAADESLVPKAEQDVLPEAEESGAASAEDVAVAQALEDEPEPPSPPEAPRAPVPSRPSDWDFMAEEDEDSIGSFWENPEPPPESAIALAAVEAQSTPETLEEPAAEAPSETLAQPRTEARHEPPIDSAAETAPDAPAEALVEEPAEAAPFEEVERIDAVEAAIEDPRALAITDSFDIERIEPDFAAPVAEPEPQPEPGSEPEQWPEPEPVRPSPTEPSEDTVPTFRPIVVADPDPSDVVVTPEWVDAPEESEADQPKRSGGRFVGAIVGVGLLALAAALAMQPDGRVAAAGDTTPPAAVAPAPKQSAGIASPPPKAATKEPEGRTPARPVPAPPLPTLPGRELAFVSASVLQCRSAPVERSAPVRKLVRGAQVQILAREGEWVSVAHKGRQCWAAGRFLSAAEPW